MKKLLSMLGAVGVITLASAFAMSDEPAKAQAVYKPFNVIYIDSLGSDGEKAQIRNRATKSSVAALQNEILSDHVLANKLKARGIQIRNIIARDQALDGSFVYYVR